MNVTIDQINEWLLLPSETQNLEFKEARKQYDYDKLCSYCVALANEDGGQFVLGITDKVPREVLGSRAYPNTTKITSQLFNKLGFRVDVVEFLHPDGRILVFDIPARPRGTAYEYEGKYLMRSGESLVPMSEDRLRRIFAEGQPNFLGEIALDNVTGDRFVQLLDTQSFFDLRNETYPTNRDEVIERFDREGFVKDRNGLLSISNLGALLFAKSLRNFPTLEFKAPRVLVYEGNNKLVTKLDQIGGLGYAMGFSRLLEYIRAQIPKSEEIETDTRRTTTMFHPVAIRELVANALIHQDFTITGAQVRIELYSDRLEISNPGTPEIRLDRFIDGDQSRNEKLANVMRRLKICELRGSGIDRVVEVVEEWQLPAPEFREFENRTITILYAHKEFADMNKEERIRACYQHTVLRYVNNEITNNSSLRTRFGLDDDKYERASAILRDTVRAGQIKSANPVGSSRKYATYLPNWA